MPSDLKKLYLSNLIMLTDYGPYALTAKGRVPVVVNDWPMVDSMQRCS